MLFINDLKAIKLKLILIFVIVCPNTVSFISCSLTRFVNSSSTLEEPMQFSQDSIKMLHAIESRRFITGIQGSEYMSLSL